MKNARRMTLFIVMIITVLMLFTSCRFFQPSPTICDKPEASNSVICKVTAELGLTPEKVGVVLRLAAAMELDANPDEAEKALEYLNKALILLEDNGLTYYLFAQFFEDNTSMFVTIAAEELLAEMGTLDMLMDPFDRNMIKIHFTRQRDMVASSLARTK
jgi:hypothetical protein